MIINKKPRCCKKTREITFIWSFLIKMRGLRCAFFSLTENYYWYMSACEIIKYLRQINHKGAVINLIDLINQQDARRISIIYVCFRSSCSELRCTFCNIIIINGSFSLLCSQTRHPSLHPLFQPSRWWERHATRVSSFVGCPPGTPAECLHQRCLFAALPSGAGWPHIQNNKQMGAESSPTIIRCYEVLFFKCFVTNSDNAEESLRKHIWLNKCETVVSCLLIQPTN